VTVAAAAYLPTAPTPLVGTRPGANIVVKKPVSPKALFEHMLWIARGARPFIETGNFIGPDRRFRTVEPPDGKLKRETDDSLRNGDLGTEESFAQA